MWLRFISGTSAFVYGTFCIFSIISLAMGWNRIQLVAVPYGLESS